jgi:hypothetical protein
MHKFLRFFILGFAICSSAKANSEFTVNLSERIRLLNILIEKSTLEVSISRTKQGESEISIGGIYIEIANQKSNIPICLAKLVRSESPEDFKISIGSPSKQDEESHLIFDFINPSPDQNNGIRLKYQIHPLVPLSIERITKIGAEIKTQPISLRSLCEPIEINLLAPVLLKK